MDHSDKEMSFGAVQDGEMINKKAIRTIGNIEVDVNCVQRDKQNFAYYATLKEGSAFYQVVGDMGEEVFENLVKNIEFW